MYGAPLIYHQPVANRDLRDALFQLNSLDSDLGESPLSEGQDKNQSHAPIAYELIALKGPVFGGIFLR